MARKKKPTDSPAIQLLELVWQHNCAVVPHTWERVNHSMGRALELAIGAGLRFAPGDFDTIADRYRPDRWYGEQGGEQFYRLAVIVANVSAAMAWEASRQRRPLLADDVESPYAWSAVGYCHTPGRRVRERLFVGAEFAYQGHRATVTSFRVDGKVVACTYRDARHSKVARRYVVGWEDIVADRHDRQARRELYEQLMAHKQAVIDAFCRAARIKTTSDYWTAPLGRLQKAAQEVLPKAESGEPKAESGEPKADTEGVATDARRGPSE